MKLADKAKELGISSKELTAILNDAGYIYSSYNANLKDDALQFLFIEYGTEKAIPELEDGIPNAVLVSVGDKFAVVKILINSKLEIREISRTIFESKVRAHYEVNYLNDLFETGR